MPTQDKHTMPTRADISIESTPFAIKLGIATAMGLALGIWPAIGMVQLFNETVGSLTLGAVVGLVQWTILRIAWNKTVFWIPITTCGFGAGFEISSVLLKLPFRIENNLYLGTLAMGLVGLMIGLSQWLYLKKTLRGSSLWVAISTVAWAISGGINWHLALPFTEPLKIAFDYLIIAITVGTITTTAAIAAMAQRGPIGNPNPTRGFKTGLPVILSVFILASAVGFRHNVDKYMFADKQQFTLSWKSPPVDCHKSFEHFLSKTEQGAVGQTPNNLTLFAPAKGLGYINYPFADETWDDQYRSYLQNKATLIIKYATQKTACMTRHLDHAPLRPLGLGDMSEHDGAIPGSSRNNKTHLNNTHTAGTDIDIAYYQLSHSKIANKDDESPSALNIQRAVCKHTFLGVDLFHCTTPPHLLDAVRTALFLVYISESNAVRVIGVDGQVAPMIQKALNLLQKQHIILPNQTQLPIAFETTNQMRGWFWHHHHHLHISFNLQ